MGAGDLAFFAFAGLSLATVVMAARRSSARWRSAFWISCLPHAWLFHAPLAGLAFLAAATVEFLRGEMPEAGEHRADVVGRSSRIGRAVFSAALAFIFLGTLARQVVTPGESLELRPALGRIEMVGPNLLGPQFGAFALLVGLALAVALRRWFSELGDDAPVEGEGG